MLLKPGAQRGWYHGRKPQFREFQSLFAGTGTKLESKGRHHSMARQSVMGTAISLSCGVVHLVVTSTVFA